MQQNYFTLFLQNPQKYIRFIFCQMWFVSIFRPYLIDNDFFVSFVLYLASAKECAQDIDTPLPPTLHFSPFSSSTELPT